MLRDPSCQSEVAKSVPNELLLKPDISDNLTQAILRDNLPVRESSDSEVVGEGVEPHVDGLGRVTRHRTSPLKTIPWPWYRKIWKISRSMRPKMYETFKLSLLAKLHWIEMNHQCSPIPESDATEIEPPSPPPPPTQLGSNPIKNSSLDFYCKLESTH